MQSVEKTPPPGIFAWKTARGIIPKSKVGASFGVGGRSEINKEAAQSSSRHKRPIGRAQKGAEQWQKEGRLTLAGDFSLQFSSGEASKQARACSLSAGCGVEAAD